MAISYHSCHVSCGSRIYLYPGSWGMDLMSISLRPTRKEENHKGITIPPPFVLSGAEVAKACMQSSFWRITVCMQSKGGGSNGQEKSVCTFLRCDSFPWEGAAEYSTERHKEEKWMKKKKRGGQQKESRQPQRRWQQRPPIRRPWHG